MIIYALGRQRIFSKVATMNFYNLTQMISEFNYEEDTQVIMPESRFKRHNEGFQKSLSDPQKFFNLLCVSLEKLGLGHHAILYDTNQLQNKSCFFYIYNKFVKGGTPMSVCSFLSAISSNTNDVEKVVQELGDLGVQFTQNAEEGISG